MFISAKLQAADSWSSIAPMQEFSSVTASSYDAESLAPLLNDKAADGWSVVSIVAAGSNVVAYLQREVDESAVSTDAPAEEAPTHDDAGLAAAAAAAVVAEEPAVDDAPAAVDEPAGWAAAPDDAGSADTSADDAPTETSDAVADAPTDVAEASIADLGAGVVAATPAEPEDAPASTPVAEATPAESTVPAGWYADPSSRYELRYWDGLAWTEHVSRAGQQFTDPPVA